MAEPASDASPGKPGPTATSPTSNGRAGRLIAVAVAIMAVALCIYFAHKATDRHRYLLERTYRMLDRVTAQIVARVDGTATMVTLGEANEGGKPAPTHVAYDSALAALKVTPVIGKMPDGMDGAVEIRDIFESVVYQVAQFDDVFLVNDRGRSRFHVGGTGSDDVIDLNALAKAHRDVEKPSDTRTGVTGVITEWIYGRSVPNAGWDKHARWVGSDRPTSLLFRREPYLAFCHPLSWKSGTTSATPLFVCGLRLEQTVHDETTNIPPALQALMGLALAATLVAWPILKVGLLGPQERLRNADARLLVLATIAGVGFLSFGVVAWHGQRRLTHVFDRDARSVAGHIEHTLRRELLGATRRLVRFDELVSHTPNVARLCADVGGSRGGTISNFVRVGGSRGAIAALCLRSPNGHGLGPKMSAKLASDRQYFKDVQAGHVARLPWDRVRKKTLPGVTLDVIQTRSTGEVVVAVAMAHGGGPKPDVVAVATTPRALFQPILPPDLGFAVVDDDGNVQLHSDMRRAKTENFYEECDNPFQLATLVKARTGGSISVDYYGTERPRLYVHPLAGTPWTLIVFHERTAEVTAMTAMVVAWATTFCAYLLVLAVVLVLMSTRGPVVRMHWLWPVANRAYAYGWMVIGLVILGLLATAACSAGTRPAVYPTGLLLIGWMAALYVALERRVTGLHSIAWVALGVAVVGMAAMLPPPWALWAAPATAAALFLVIRGARRSVDSGFEGAALRPRYVAMVTLIILGLGAWPSVVLFGDAWNGVTAALVRQAELRYARAYYERVAPRDREKKRHWAPFPVRTSSGLPSAVHVTAELDAPTSRSGRFVAEHLCATRAGATPARPDDCRALVALADRSLASFGFLVAPAFTAGAADLQELAVGTHARDGSWASARHGDDLHLTLLPDAPIATLSLRATLPRLGLPHTALGWAAGLALLALVGAVTGVVVRFIVLRLFAIGPNMPDRSLVARPHVVPTVWLFARLDGLTIDDLLGDPARALVRYDLRTLPTSTRIVPPPAGAIVVVDWLETRLGDAAWSARLLTDLEALVFGGADLVIVCGTDPVFFLADQVATLDDANPATAAVLDRFARWTRVLGACASAVRAVPWRDPRATPLRKLLAEHQPAEDVRTRDAWYWQLWGTSTLREKLAMTQLAAEGFFNPNAHDVVRHLLDRGLLFRNPELTFFDPDFRDFVLRAEAPMDVRAWEQAGGASGWSRLQRPLAIAIVGVLGILVLVQPDVYTIALGILTGFTTLLPKILDVLGQFGQKPSAR